MQAQAYHNKRGFTLIELLLVIALIVILASILLAALHLVQERGRIAKAQSDAATIANAIRAYHHEYSKWPAVDDNGNWTGKPDPITDHEDILECLDPQNSENPHHVVFLEMTNTIINDPWGVPYEITIDPMTNEVRVVSTRLK
jgi:prepilin-type N-terminal cleavage/methylation domain-containing protein